MSEVGLDPLTIYAYDSHRNIPWNVVEYQPVREYLDPAQSIREQKVRDGALTYDRYATKRGSFIDQHVKNVKELPAPCKYDFPSEFDQTENKKESIKHPIDLKLKKGTYLEFIEKEAKLRKTPAVGQYQLTARSHQSKRSSSKVSDSTSRRFFYQDAEFLSTAVPGSGCYYPHDSVPNIRKERTNHHFWIDKHSKMRETSRKRSLKEPDPGSYCPLAASFNSFDKIKVDDQKRRKKQEKKKPSHGFGSSDSKFEYTRSKKGKAEARPDPCNYNTMIDWKGKGADATKNNWVRCLSAGPTRSVYH